MMAHLMNREIGSPRRNSSFFMSEFNLTYLRSLKSHLTFVSLGTNNTLWMCLCAILCLYCRGLKVLKRFVFNPAGLKC